jgi:hypothetical protein
MRFRILLASALVALAAPAAAVADESDFHRDYLDDQRAWDRMVPPPALADLPAEPYTNGRTCKERSDNANVQAYCRLSADCDAGPIEELRPWCEALTDVINGSPSLKSCQAAPTQYECTALRDRIHRGCYRPPNWQGPVAGHVAYRCDSFFAVYPDDRTRAPGGAAPLPPGQVPGNATDIEVDDDDGRGDADVVGQNGGRSPFCQRSGLDSAARDRCEQTGSIARRYPLSSYGLDNHIELGVTKVGNFFPSAIQSIGAVVWNGLILAINGVLLILEWAFSLDLVGRAMEDIRVSLTHLHEEVLGQSWMLLAISVAGLWGIWNGLVRLRTIQTLGGLAMTVVLMCAALILIHNPRDTVGHFSALANESSLSAMSAASQGTIENPPAAYAKANEKLFDALVLRPWCGLQFGDVDYCFQRPGRICERGEDGIIDDGDDSCRDFGGTVADAWLEHPAGSETRTRLFRWLKEHDAGKVRLQEKGGTGSRIGLLALIAVGLLGAIALFLYLAIKLMLAAIFTLVLLLAAPVMLVVPAFGDAGRNAFLTWLKRLGGAIAAKLIYALLLAMVILIAGVIASLDGIGWYPKWMLLMVFWWGVLIKRKDLVGFVMPSNGANSGLGIAKAYFGYRAVKDIGRDAIGMATYAPKKAARAGAWGARKTRNELGLRRRSRDDAIKRDAGRHLQRRAHGALSSRNAADLSRAQGLLAGASSDRSRLGQVNSELSGTESELRSVDRDLERALGDRDVTRAELLASSGPGGSPGRRAALNARMQELNRRIPDLQRRQTALGTQAGSLRAERVRLEGRLADPDIRWAQSVASRAGPGGIEVRDGEIRDWIRQRERELGEQLPEHDSADDARDRELIMRIDGEGLSRGARSAANRELRTTPDHQRIIRGEAREIRRSIRREDSWSRRRSGMFR